jgi:SAM-dependent methyltransferase
MTKLDMAAGVAAVVESVEQLPDVLKAARATPTRESDRQIGEAFARMSAECGRVAAAYLFRSQWSYVEPEWFDHRLHILDPENHFNDFWTASADNVIGILPLAGRLLDLCSGDGFYDYWFYRFRADVTCVERNREVYEFARKHHRHSRIRHILADVLDYRPIDGHFDVVVIRGAIEHFSREDQQRVFRKAMDALKPGGYFCGDTPAKKEDGTKALGAHEYEWADEDEMRRALGSVFSQIETRTLVSEARTTLFWRCRKPCE